MMLSGLSKRERYILYLCIAIVLGCLLYGFVLEPLALKWIKLNQKILSQKIRLEKNYRIIANKDIIKKEYQRYANYVKTVDSDEEVIAALLQEIENLARNCNVRINDIKPKEVKDLRFYKRFTIEIESEGQIEQLSKFIYQLQKSSQLLRVQRLHLGARGTQKSLLKSHMLITKISLP